MDDERNAPAPGRRHWADGLTRHCHIDSHFGAFRQVYQRFDAARTAATIAEARFQTATFFAKCWAGYSYYPTRIGVPHPGLACDFTGQLARALAREGVRRLVYFNLGQERRLHRTHPEWIVNHDARAAVPAPAALGEVATMCQRSPYTEQVGVPQMLEILDHCDVDGFFIDIFMHQTLEGVCYCPCCADAFRRDTGLELPASDADASAFAYRRWANATFAAVVERTYAALAARKPEVLLLVNWAYMTRFPLDPPSFIRQLTWDTPVPKAGSFAWNFSFESRYLHTLGGVTWSVMNTRGNSWQEYSLREPEALLQECATTVAAGGGTYLADVGHPSGVLDPAVYELFGRVNRRTAELEEQTRGCQPVPEVAVLHSADSVWSKAPCQPSPAWTPSPAYHSVCGTHKALVEGQVQVAVLNSQRLPELLPRYRALILPDQRILSERECAAIRGFVAAGGGLVAMAATGLRGEDNVPLADSPLADVLGVRYRGLAPYRTAYLRVPSGAGVPGVPAMDVQVVGPSVRLEAAGARVLLDYVPPYEGLTGGIPPAAEQADGAGVTLATWGRGIAVCCAVDLGAALFTEGTPMLRRLLLWLVGLAHPDRARQLLVSGVPVGVEVFHSRGPGRDLVHLINYACDKRETGTPQTQGFPSLEGIDVSLSLPRPPLEVSALADGRTVPAEYRDGRVRFRACLRGPHAVYQVRTSGDDREPDQHGESR